MPGAMPSLISGWPNFAVSAAMMKSAIIASSQPPPRAKPETAAIQGFRVAVTCPKPAKKFSPNIAAKPLVCISLISAPAAKAFSLPVSTRQSWVGIGIIGGEGGDQLAQHLGVERVQRLRAVEAQQRDGAMLFGKEGFIGHVLLRFEGQ